MGRVLETPAAPPHEAHPYFAHKLAVETDPSDVQHDVRAGDAAGFVVVDTRSEEAFVKAHVPGAVHLPYAAMDEATAAHFLPDKDRVAVCYCWGPYCNAADKGAARLSALGYKVKVMLGGMDAWRHEGYPIEGAEAGRD